MYITHTHTLGIHPLHERSQTKVDSYPTSAEGKLIISDDDITDDITSKLLCSNCVFIE